MIATTANYDAMAAKMPLEPIYRFSVEDYSKVFVYRATGNLNEFAWIASIDDWSVSVDPTNGSYSIDPLNVHVIDYQAQVTHDVGLLILEGRRCKLQQGWPGLALADYVTLFSGIVNTVTSEGGHSYSFACADYNRLNQRLVFITGDDGSVVTTVTTYNATQPYTRIVRTSVTNPSTGVVTETASVSYQGTGAPASPGTTVVTSGGVTTTTVITSRSVDFGAGPVTIYEETITAVGNNTTVVTTLELMGAQLYTNIITTTQTNQVNGLVTSSIDITFTDNGTVGTSSVSDNSYISGTNPRRLVGHPLDMLLFILQKEIGYADSDINISLVEEYRDTVFSGVEFDFTLTGSVDAKDFIENQLLKPLAGYLFPNNLGQLCVGFAQPLNGGISAGAALTPNNMTDIPDIGAADLINVVTMRFDKDDDNVGTSVNSTGYLAEANTYFLPSIDDITDLTGNISQEAATGASAVQGQLIIESDGMRSGFQGFLLAKMVSNAIFSLYGSYNPTLESTAHWFPCFKTELSEFLTVTHPLLPNRATGTMGLVNQMTQAVRRSYNFADMTVTFSLQDASGIKSFGAHRIAPTGHADYPTSSTADQARYLFMANTSGKQANNDAAGTLG